MQLKQGDIITHKNGSTQTVLEVIGQLVAISRTDPDEAIRLFTEKQILRAGWSFPKEQWEPKVGEEYYFIDGFGMISMELGDGGFLERARKSFLGIFRTKEEAQARLEEIKNLLK